MKRFFLFLFILSHPLFAINNYLLFDNNMSPYASSEDFIFLHHSLVKIEDEIAQIPNDHHHLVKALGRFMDQFFIWLPINSVMVTTQHEIFGHGYQIRDFGSDVAKVNKYIIHVPFPYGKGGGETRFTISAKAQAQDIILIDIAGVNATAILANRIKLHWLQNQKLPGRMATLYLEAEHDLTNYILQSSSHHVFFDTGNDIIDYIKWLNIAYPQGPITHDELRRLALLNFADPFSFYSFFSFFEYIATGKASNIYMIPIGRLKYLPGLRLGLAPYGPEIFFENFFVYNGLPIYAYIKGGKHAGNHYFGLGFEAPKLHSWSIYSIGFRFDGWRHPSASSPFGFLTALSNDFDNVNNEFTYKTIYGAGLSIINQLAIPETPLSLYAQTGYKLKGFLPGEPFHASPILRFGISLDF